jgi:hypothetical protein
MMEWTSIRSTNIREAGFDAETNELEIVFADGARYRYRSVPESIYQELVSARSAGRYFHQKIRDRYSYTRV